MNYIVTIRLIMDNQHERKCIIPGIVWGCARVFMCVLWIQIELLISPGKCVSRRVFILLDSILLSPESLFIVIVSKKFHKHFEYYEKCSIFSVIHFRKRNSEICYTWRELYQTQNSASQEIRTLHKIH